MLAPKVLTRLEARLYFHTPCFYLPEILQVIRLQKALPDLLAVIHCIPTQAALFPNKAEILAVLKAEYDNQKEDGKKDNQDNQKENPFVEDKRNQDKRNQEENPFVEAKRAQKENSLKERFREKVGKEDWKKTKRIIDAFQGRIVAVTCSDHAYQEIHEANENQTRKQTTTKEDSLKK